jgi:hypothetical protein
MVPTINFNNKFTPKSVDDAFNMIRTNIPNNLQNETLLEDYYNKLEIPQLIQLSEKLTLFYRSDDVNYSSKDYDKCMLFVKRLNEEISKRQLEENKSLETPLDTYINSIINMRRLYPNAE